MIEIQHKKCPVCGEEFAYMDVRDVPITCYRTMCRQNYKSYRNRQTVHGDKPSLKEMGVWQPSKDYEKSPAKPSDK
jgi:hypothetical protein